VRVVVRRVVVEIELADDVKLEELLRGVKYRVLRGGLWESIEKVRKRYMEKLGGSSSLEEYEQLEEELWQGE
jgi:hypothetical protein